MLDYYLEEEVVETPADHGWVKEEEVPDMAAVHDYLTGIMESVYKDGNMNRLEGCIEELCHLFDLKYEGGERKLEPKKQGDLMQWYLGYQRATIDQLHA